MRNHFLYLAGIIGLSISLVTPGTADDRHLFIISGQSNTAGIDLNRFSRMINRVIDTSRTVIVKDYQPGAPILRWYKGWTKADGAPDPVILDPEYAGYYGDLYDRLMAGVDTAMAGHSPLTVSLVWMQGEEDASVRIQGGTVYEQSLRGLVAQFEADLGVTGMFVSIARISDAGFTDARKADVPGWEEVRQAQVRFAESDVRYGWFDTDSFNDPADDIHYPAYGYALLTQSFADKALELLCPFTDDVPGYTHLTYPDTVYYDAPDSAAAAVFVDDFNDSDFTADASPGTGTATGIAWEQPVQDADFTIRPGHPDSTPALFIPCGGAASTHRPLLIKSVLGDTGRVWKNYAVDFRVYNHNIGGFYGDAGVALLVNGFDRYYVFATTFAQASFSRVMPDSAGEPRMQGLFACNQLEIPAGTVGYYRVVAEPRDDTICFYFGYGATADEARMIRRVYVDTDPTVVAAFADGGGIGFYRNYPYATSYQSYDDVSVKVFSYAGDDTAVSRVAVPAQRTEVGGIPCPVTGPVAFSTVNTYRTVRLYGADGRPAGGLSGEDGRYLLDPSGVRPGLYLLRAGDGALVRRVVITD